MLTMQSTHTMHQFDLSDVADTNVLRRLLSRWTTGITIITTIGEDGVPLGKAANSFHSVSLDPPLVGWCVDVRSTRYAEWLAAPGYAVHIMGESQTELVKHFARRGGDKFADIPWEPGPFGMPLLESALLRLECRMWKQLEAGDHTYLIGEIVGVAGEREGSGTAYPLLFHDGKPASLYELFAALGDTSPTQPTHPTQP